MKGRSLRAERRSYLGSHHWKAEEKQQGRHRSRSRPLWEGRKRYSTLNAVVFALTKLEESLGAH